MKSTRRLHLRRESLTALDSDELAQLAGGHPLTLSLCTTTLPGTYRCPAVNTTILETIRSTGATECTSR